jgi:hypothetical protein
MIATNGEPAVREILESHYISPAATAILMRRPFAPTDFEEFLVERQRTLQHAIESLLIKERFDLTPTLRELDERLERAELGLRAVVARVLDDDPGRLPTHVAPKLKDRIDAHVRRNPNVDPEQFTTLTGRLEYADLRELQETITAKSTWVYFENRFGTKELLDARFGQLAGLRNALRHARTVDDITRMDGEAALLWFEQALNRAAA